MQKIVLLVLSAITAQVLWSATSWADRVLAPELRQESQVLRVASNTQKLEAPEGVVYCGGGQIKRQIEYIILSSPKDQWDVRVTVNGKQIKAMTAYSYFGSSAPPKGFLVALLGEDRSEFLVFKDGEKDWLEFGDYTYRKCN